MFGSVSAIPHFGELHPQFPDQPGKGPIMASKVWGDLMAIKGWHDVRTRIPSGIIDDGDGTQTTVRAQVDRFVPGLTAEALAATADSDKNLDVQYDFIKTDSEGNRLGGTTRAKLTGKAAAAAIRRLLAGEEFTAPPTREGELNPVEENGVPAGR